MEIHQRRLPHLYPDRGTLFVTFRLHGSLPASMAVPPGNLSAGQAFAWIDRRLDTARQGPLYLGQPAIAKIVVDAIHKGEELGHYILYAHVVMPNHVHLLIQPKISPSYLLKSLKGVTARHANKALGRTGEPFWQKESYDHWVSNETEFNKIQLYIENNPVRAGLASRPELPAAPQCWPSSAGA
jgi:REP element-mobilizing transposase RayT